MLGYGVVIASERGPDDFVDGLALPVLLKHGKARSHLGCLNEMPLFNQLEV